MSNVRAAGLYMVPSALGMVVPFATLPILTRWLTPADYGLFALAQIVAGLFAGLASCEIRLGVERNFFKYEADRRALGHLIYGSLLIVLAGTVAWGVLLLAAVAPLSTLLYGTSDWSGLIAAAAIGGSLNMLMTIPLIYLRNSGRPRAFAGFQVGGMLLESGLAVLLVAGFELGVWGLALGPVLGRLLIVLALWGRLMAELPFGISWSISSELVRLGVPLLPRVVVSTADGGVDRVLIGLMASLGQVGLFSMANRVGGGVFAFMTGIEQVFMPTVFRLLFKGEGKPRESAVAVGRYLSPFFYASIAVGIVAILFTEELLFVLVPPAFYGVRELAAVLAAYYAQMFFGKVVGVQLMYRELTAYVTRFTLFRLVVHGALSVVMVLQYGALGACFALLLGSIVVDGIAMVFGQRYCPVRYEARLVIPGVALLYTAMGWVLGTPVLHLGYATRLAGKAVILIALLLLGLRWAPLIYRRLTGFMRPQMAPGGRELEMKRTGRAATAGRRKA